MVKTQTEAECAELRRLLPSYADYMHRHPQSWLVRFYGMYCVRCQPGTRPVYFVVMNNVFDTRQQLSERYDLKGSTVGRLTADARGSAILKDLDLLRSTSRVRVGASRRHSLLEQLRQDATFLSEQSYIDYSLLLGIHRPRLPMIARLARALGLRRRRTDGVLGRRGRDLYYMGVIDILQKYTPRKFAETCLKALRYPVWGVSCIWPSAYCRRFCEFAGQVVE